MELTKYIKENKINNYDKLKIILESEPFNLKIKEDIHYNHLFLIHNQENSDFNLKIVNECNGIILNKNSLEIVCYTFDKCLDNETDFPDNYLDNDNLFIEKSIEGTLVRLFYDHYINDWVLSTKKCIDASKSRWISYKTFDLLFNDCFNNDNDYKELLEKLAKHICYSFIITHPENKMVVQYSRPLLFHISSRDMITLEELHLDIGINKISKTYLPKQNIKGFLNAIYINTDVSYEGYIFIDTYFRRWKFKTPFFKKIKDIWGNTNNRFFYYLNLRKNSILLKEYLYYFSYDKDSFKKYETILTNLTKKIINSYYKKFIDKTEIKVPFYFSKIIYKLHGDYQKDKIKTDFNKVSHTLLNTDSKLICYMINNLNEDLDQQENNEEYDEEYNNYYNEEMIEKVMDVET